MPHISAFRGLRYDLGHVGSLEGVVAAACDGIDNDLQNELYKQHPSNVIRLIRNRDEPGDSDDAKYARAARFFRNWQQEGVLQREPDPAIYVYHQVFDHDGTKTRRGFIALTRLEPPDDGTIYPLEETQASSKDYHLKLTQACQANLSPVLGIYPDPQSATQEILESAIIGVAPVEARDQSGVVHRLWPVSDIHVINQLSSTIASKPIYIAAGQDRYEAACEYKSQLVADGLDMAHGANHAMMMCVAIDDPGMTVLPTHRLFRGGSNLDSDELKAKLSTCFDVRIAGEGVDLAEMIWDQIEIEGEQGTIGMYTAKDERWLVAKLNEDGMEKMNTVASEHSGVWQSLGFNILHQLILDTLLEQEECKTPLYVHRIEDVIDQIETSDGDNSIGMAALVLPPTLEDIREISDQGERLPAQSTCFYPEPLSGLVFNPHEGLAENDRDRSAPAVPA